MYSIRFIWIRVTAAGRERMEREQAAGQPAAPQPAAHEEGARAQADDGGSGRRTPSPAPLFARLSRPAQGRPYAARRIARVRSRCIAPAR